MNDVLRLIPQYDAMAIQSNSDLYDSVLDFPYVSLPSETTLEMDQARDFFEEITCEL